MRILCIDDTVMFAEEIASWLTPQVAALKWDYASTLEQGLALLRQCANAGTPYEVLLIDLALPGETLGLLVFPQLRTDYPAMTIIGLAGANQFIQDTVTLGPKIVVTKKPTATQVILDTLKMLETVDA